MNVCKDLSFLEGLKCNQFNTIKEQFFRSCFPGIKTWLLNYFKADDYNNILVKNALHQYRINIGIKERFSDFEEEEINEAMSSTNLSDISKELLIIYTKYFFFYYDGLHPHSQFMSDSKHYAENIYGRVEYIRVAFYSNARNISINNYTIYDRLKIKIIELSEIINNNLTDELHLHRIIVKKRYINLLVDTINNLPKYIKDKKVRITTQLEELKKDKKVNDGSLPFEEFIKANKKIDEFNKILQTEKLKDTYQLIDPYDYVLSIIQINNDNHTALVKFKINQHSDKFIYSIRNQWINLEYLEVV